MIELLLQAEGALSVGLLDRAETLYRQVAGADPRNSIAVVGLARVALERRDEARALALARRALAIDPENAAARRMVERFEEVLRYRGQSPAVSEPEPPATPKSAAPEPPATPESAAPESTPESAAPESTPESAAPATPKSAAPESAAPATPESAASEPPATPESAAPEPPATPESAAPESTPESAAPESAPPAPGQPVPAAPGNASRRRSFVDRLLRRR